MCLGRGRPEYRILRVIDTFEIWSFESAFVCYGCLSPAPQIVLISPPSSSVELKVLCLQVDASLEFPSIDPSTNFLFHALVFVSRSSLFCWGALSHLEGQFSWLVGVSGSSCFSLLLSRILRLLKLLLFWVAFFYSKWPISCLDRPKLWLSEKLFCHCK